MRRWIKFRKIVLIVGEVFCLKNFVTTNKDKRVSKDSWIVIALQKGNKKSNRYVIMSVDSDSRNSDFNDFINDAPGANDNAYGMAGTIEAARVLSEYKFDYNIVYLGISAKEQVLFEGKGFAEYAKKNN